MKNLITATILGILFTATFSIQTANAQRTGFNEPVPDFWKRSSNSRSSNSTANRYAVYVYDVNYSYPIFRNGKRYTATGRYRSTFNNGDAQRIATTLRTQYKQWSMKAWVNKRFYRWSYNR